MFVYYSRPNVLSVFHKDGEEFTFIPGNNQISKRLWNDLLTNPNFKRRFDAGVFKITSEVETEENDNVLEPLGSAEAKSMVRETYDPVLLRKWKAVETRKTVMAVIDEQLDAADKRIAERQKKTKPEED